MEHPTRTAEGEVVHEFAVESNRGGVRVSYTWSKSLDNVGEFFFSSPIDLFDIWKDYGRSDDDQRHRAERRR